MKGERTRRAAHVAIVGAGWAGLAAAVTLAERGTRVTVYEASRQLGGRARRVEIEGIALDNGQHILIGAYGETLRLMRTVGVDAREALLRMPLDLRMANGFRLRAPALPAPLGVAVGLLTAKGLSFIERQRALRFALALRASRFRLAQDQTVAALLDRHKQNGALRHSLWTPLCVAALNTPIEHASAQIFLNVLRDTIAASADASDLLLPRASLGELFPEPAAQFVRAQGGDVRLGAPVRDLAALRDQHDAVIVATAPQHASALLDELPATRAIIDGLDYEPIYTCYLQYAPDTRLPAPMLGFNGGFVQWAFDRGALDGHAGLIAAVVSAQGAHQEVERDAFAAQVDRELRASFPHWPAPHWTRVIAEKRATFACRPNIERPDNATTLPWLFLAGDYTAGDYPATIEAAVRSGVRAAELALQRDR